MQNPNLPLDWQSISFRIRRRDAYRCTACGSPEGAWGFWDANGSFITVAKKALIGAGYPRVPAEIPLPGGTLVVVAPRVRVVQLVPGAGFDDANLAVRCARCLTAEPSAEKQKEAA